MVAMTSWVLLPNREARLRNRRPNVSAGSKTTFERSLIIFKKKLASHVERQAWIDDLKATTLQDVVAEVAKARAMYDKKKGVSETRNSILSFSKRINHYGKVLDVMVQHHPEYVSLAWGALKLVFGVCNSQFDNSKSDRVLTGIHRA